MTPTLPAHKIDCSRALISILQPSLLLGKWECSICMSFSLTSVHPRLTSAHRSSIRPEPGFPIFVPGRQERTASWQQSQSVPCWYASRRSVVPFLRARGSLCASSEFIPFRFFHQRTERFSKECRWPGAGAISRTQPTTSIHVHAFNLRLW